MTRVGKKVDKIWKCPVRGCLTRAKRGFYRIPEHPVRRSDWIKALKFPIDIKKSTTVCFKHFKKEDFEDDMDPEFVNELGMGRLKQMVVPSLLLPEDPVELDMEFDLIEESVVTQVEQPVVNTDSDIELGDLVIIFRPMEEHNYANPNPDPKLLDKKSHEAKDGYIKKLKKQNTLLKNQKNSILGGKVPKTLQQKILGNVLVGKGYFTKKQVQQFGKPVRTEGKRDKKGNLIIKGMVISEGIFKFFSILKKPNQLNSLSLTFIRYPLFNLKLQGKGTVIIWLTKFENTF